MGQAMKRKNAKTKPIAAAPAILMRDPRSGIQVAALNDDGPTLQRGQHDSIENGWKVGSEIGRSKRVTTQRIIDRLLKRGTITSRQWQAADRLRSLHYHAGLEPRVVADLSRAGSGGECTYGMAANERQADARRQLRVALGAAGAAVSGVMIEVVCYDVEPTAWAAAKGRHWSWVRPLLDAGLDELVRHWRL